MSHYLQYVVEQMGQYGNLHFLSSTTPHYPPDELLPQAPPQWWKLNPFVLQGELIAQIKALCSLDTSLGGVALAPGANQAILQSLSAVASLGDKVLCEYPIYDPVIFAAKTLGIKLEFFDRTGDFETDLKSINSKLQTARYQSIFLTNPHNPCGHFYQKKELLIIAQKFPTAIISEVYWPLVSKGSPSAISCENLCEHNILTIHGLTKTLGVPGLRFSWINGPTDLINKMNINCMHLFIHLPVLTTYLAKYVLENWTSIINHHLDHIIESKKIITQILRETQVLERLHLDSQYFGSLEVPANFPTAVDFAQTLKKQGTLVFSCEHFGQPKHWRWSCLTEHRSLHHALPLLTSHYE